MPTYDIQSNRKKKEKKEDKLQINNTLKTNEYYILYNTPPI